ncbi:MMPL family transporter [Caenibacillus caldisaponilyticus]|uniref:MMPL family transporter n=1 Tax=Caenibacillus caldisaponilyticus TaxID=1674942 RepID=UPI0009888B06|nr:MMPL family transporter [Caenibacillus caldisaponilyticus]
MIAKATGPKGRWVTILLWVMVVAFLSAVFPSVNKEETNSPALLPDNVMSAQAAKVVKKEFPNNAGTPLLIVWERDGGLQSSDYEAVRKLYDELSNRPLPHQSFIPPLNQVPQATLQRSTSQDGAALITPVFFKENTPTDILKDAQNQVKKRLEKLLNDQPFGRTLSANGLHVRFTGPAAIQTDAVELFSRADITLLMSTIFLVLILLVLLYRSPILAVVPLIGVVFAYGAISPILGLLAHHGWITVDAQAVSIMTVLLFGAGTDYCLFLISRYRDELHLESDKYIALHRAVTDTGGAIIMSALTVVIALLTLLFARYASFHRFAVPFSLAIFVMGLAALTLIPALLSVLGRISFFPFIPRTEEMARKLEQEKGKQVKRHTPRSRLSSVMGRLVTQKPRTIIIGCLIGLGLLAVFSSRIQFTYGLLDSFPNDMPSRVGFDIIAKHFSPGELAPVQVIVKDAGAEDAVREDLSDLPYVKTVSDVRAGEKNPHYRQYQVTLAMNPYSREALKKIPEIKKTVEKSLAEAGIENPDNHVWIGGETAALYDTHQVTVKDMARIIPIVIVVIALLLLAYLRSVVAMGYLLATVLLSYVAALGAGWLVIRYILGMDAMQGLIPLYAFVFLVALGEDYNIFMVSSIWKKSWHMPLKEAISGGVTETWSVITSAGLILAGTFAVLSVLPLEVLIQFGTVTAIGILLDTFIVRPLLVPALTAVLGKRAFWPWGTERFSLLKDRQGQ